MSDGKQSGGQEARARLGLAARSYVAVARNPRYFPLWFGQLLSSFGDTLHFIALVVLVYQLTGRGIAVAVLVAAEVIPVLLLGSLAGVIIDRSNRKAVLIWADLARAGLVLTLVWPHGAGHAYLVAAGLAAGNAFFGPTIQAVIPSLTTSEQRLAVNSVAWSTARLVQIMASAVAGGVIAVLGTRLAFGLNAATFIASALLITRLRIPDHRDRDGERPAKTESILRDARAGWRFARHDRVVFGLLVVQMIASFAVGATGAMLVVLAERHLRLPPAAFAWLIGAIGVGALVGPLIPNMFAADVRDVRWLFVPYIVRGIGDVLLAVFVAPPVAVMLLVVYGLNTGTGAVVFSSVMQSVVPDRLRGRVFALFDLGWSAMRLFSLALGGLVVDAIGVRTLYWAGGTLLVMAGALGLVLLGDADVRSAPSMPDHKGKASG